MADGLEELTEQQYGLPGMDEAGRIVYLVGDMGYNAVEHLASALDHMARQSDARLQTDDAARITVRISSPGGYAGSGFALYDLLKQCSCPVDTEAMGYVGSAAVMAYLAGERRLVYRHTCMMIHGTRAEGSGSRALMDAEVRGMQWYDERSVAILSEATRRPMSFWRPQLDDGRNHDVRGGEELVRQGLATEVLQYR